MATGRYVHEIGAWDNAFPYDGSNPAWGHALLAEGHRVDAIGKLHYRSDEDDIGFDKRVDTMNVVDGVGDRLGLLRHLDTERGKAKDLALEAGRGESSYTRYDREVTKHTTQWLRDRAAAPDDKPWALFVGLVMPHLPLIAPNEFYDLYTEEEAATVLDMVTLGDPDHPWLAWLTQVIPYGKYFDEDSTLKAIRAYLGMVTFLDHNIGILLDTLADTGLTGNTRVIYASDHGEMLGHHNIWGKCCMYEDSVAVPLIMAGADIPANETNSTEVSLIDLFPTCLEAVGLDPASTDSSGTSLFSTLTRSDEERYGFSEYHAVGSKTGSFMLRRGRWKLVYYVDMEPQLFDLDADPNEAVNLAGNASHRQILDDLVSALRARIDPEEVSNRAFADQQNRIAELGGEKAILELGDFGHTPTPDETPEFERSESYRT